MKEEKIKILKAALETTDRLKNVTLSIMDGIPEAQACRAANISLNAYRRFVFNENMGFRRKDMPELKPGERILFSAEEYIFADLCGCTKRKDDASGLEIVKLGRNVRIPPSLSKTMPVVLARLSEKEYESVKMRYYKGYSYEKIGKELGGFTRECIRQIVLRALDQLRQPANMNLLLTEEPEVDEAVKRYLKAHEQKWGRVNLMKVIIKEPQKEMYATNIDNTLKSMQEIVGGKIELVDIIKRGDRRIYAVVNGMGKLKNLPENIIINEMHFYDVLHGTVFFVAGNIETGEFYSLSDDDVTFVKEFLDKFAIRERSEK